MRAKLSFVFLFAALALSGCGQTESTTTESDYISVGDYDLSQPTTYTKVTYVTGFVFEARDRDLGGTFNEAPLDILNNDVSPRYLYESGYEINDFIRPEENTEYAYKNSFYLYKPKECLYSLRTNTKNKSSLCYYSDTETAENELADYLSNLGIKNVSFQTDSHQYASDIRNGEYAYMSYFTYKKDDTDFIGAVYAAENNNGQSFFVVSGNSGHFSKEELTHIMGSYKGSTEEATAYSPEYKTEKITCDYQGILLTGEFSGKFGFTGNITDGCKGETVNDSGFTEPYFANPYSDCVLKYAVYPIQIASESFFTIYPDNSDYAAVSERITGKSEEAWQEYKRSGGNYLNHYNSSSVYLASTEYGIVCFELYYNDASLEEEFREELSSVYLELGNSHQNDLPDYLKSGYDEKFNTPEEEPATPGDAEQITEEVIPEDDVPEDAPIGGGPEDVPQSEEKKDTIGVTIQ